jgi:hypothetical protein
VVDADALLEAVGADLLRAVAGADHRSALGAALEVGLALAQLVHARAQQAPGLLAVLSLRARLLHADLEPGGQVDEVHGGRDLVHILAAGALCGGDHLLDLGGVERGVDLLGLRHDGDGRGRGVNAPLRLGGGHALDLVGAALELQGGKRACALDGGNGVRESTCVARLGLDEFESPAAAGGERAVHLEDLAGPERGLVAADAHADLEHEAGDRGLLAGDERAHDRLRELARACIERGALGLGHRDELRVARGDEFRESGQLMGASPELRQWLERPREQGAAAGELHRLAVIGRDRHVLELRGNAVILRLLGGEDPTEVLRQQVLDHAACGVRTVRLP